LPIIGFLLKFGVLNWFKPGKLGLSGGVKGFDVWEGLGTGGLVWSWVMAIL